MKKIFLLLVVALFVVSCSKDSQESSLNENHGVSGDNPTEETMSPADRELSERLSNTSWKWVKTVDSNGVNIALDPYGLIEILTFCQYGTDQINGFSLGRWTMNGKPIGYWFIKNEKLNIFSYMDFVSAELCGYYDVAIADGNADIITFNDYELVYKGSQYHYFTRSNSGGGGGSSYELPDIGFYDYTAYTTSLKVQYKIYNSSEAKVSSAKVYYGTTRYPETSVSATVSGTIITAYLNGLSRGTTYYVKCSATGPAGTTISDVTQIMTNY